MSKKLQDGTVVGRIVKSGRVKKPKVEFYNMWIPPPLTLCQATRRGRDSGDPEYERRLSKMPVESDDVRRYLVLAVEGSIASNTRAYAPLAQQFSQLSKDEAENNNLALHAKILNKTKFPSTMSFDYMGGTHREDEGARRERIAFVAWDRKPRRAMLIGIDTKVMARKYYSPSLIFNLSADQ